MFRILLPLFLIFSLAIKSEAKEFPTTTKAMLALGGVVGSGLITFASFYFYNNGSRESKNPKAKPDSSDTNIPNLIEPYSVQASGRHRVVAPAKNNTHPQKTGTFSSKITSTLKTNEQKNKPFDVTKSIAEPKIIGKRERSSRELREKALLNLGELDSSVFEATKIIFNDEMELSKLRLLKENLPHENPKLPQINKKITCLEGKIALYNELKKGHNEWLSEYAKTRDNPKSYDEH